KKIEQLIAEEKLQSAVDECTLLRQQALQANDSSLCTWTLITEAQLRISLGETEKAVVLLMTEPWPTSPLERDLLSLVYGKALTRYYSFNLWKIRQREELEDSSQANDLQTWTSTRFLSEIWRAFLQVWKDRERLSSRLIAEFPDLWKPGDYPSGIRDTLCDAVVYELSDFCLDDVFWTPDEFNNVWRLDVRRLLSSAGKTSAKEALRILTSSTTHPIEKAAAILSEHENWCRRSGRLEASLEARFSLVKAIYYLFDDRSQAFIRHHLEDFLASKASLRLPWWAMGQAQLAEWVKDEPAPDAFVRARKIALQGVERFPGSPGGIRCQSLVRLIERPELKFETMRTDAPGRRSFRISHRNLSQLDFRAFELSREEAIRELRQERRFYSGSEVFLLTVNRFPIASWQVNLEKRADYKKHVTYSGVPDNLKPGFYFIVASAPEISSAQSKEQGGFIMSISDLVMFDRQDYDRGTEQILVLSAKTGRPVSGATVELFSFPQNASPDKFEFQQLGSQKTDASGQASFKLEKVSKSYYFYTIEKDGDFNLLGHGYSGYSPVSGDKEDERRSLIYTDRAIYRPGQKILWKILCYRGSETPGQLSPETRAKVSVWLEDENQEKVAETLAVTNDFGTASGEFAVPAAGHMLGEWRLRSSPEGEASIRVEEYERPTFEVSIEDPDQALRLNYPAKIKLTARYYFGLPLSKGKVSWQVERSQSALPEGWSGRSLLSRETEIAWGTGQLNSDGTFSVEFKPEVPELEETRKKAISFACTLSVDVTDEGGETRSTKRRFILGFVNTSARIEAESGFYVAGEKASFAVSQTDLNGRPKAGRGTWRVVELVQPDKTLLPAEQPLVSAVEASELAFPPTSGDLQRPRWEKISPEEIIEQWAEGKEAASGSVKHDTQGEARVEVSGLTAGAYKLIYETKDDSGTAVRDELCFLVAGRDSGPQLKLPLVLKAEKPILHVGETARFLVSSGLEGQPIQLEFWSGNRLKESHWLTAWKDKTIIEVPVTEELCGGLTIQVLAQRDYQIMRQKVSVFVPWDNKQLKLSFATFRDKLRPGQEESWIVKVESADGRPAENGAAELLAFMYDKSLELLASHHPPSVLSLYPELTFSRHWHSNVRIDGTWYGSSQLELEFSTDNQPRSPAFILARVNLGFGVVEGAVEGGVVGGVVGGEYEEGDETIAYSVQKSVARTMISEKEEKEPAFAGEIPVIELRSDFSETAFWQPHLLT
ncbi:MAG TPA: MG2 domain-containing protein, partial [Candidatus Saccharicenans sp.]|nr:MG2 domain-containing protein [Candidatus Saccharicenans sp.]